MLGQFPLSPRFIEYKDLQEGILLDFFWLTYIAGLYMYLYFLKYSAIF